MIIALCGSTNFYDSMEDIQGKLIKLGHTALHPKDTAKAFDPSLAKSYINPAHKNDLGMEARIKKNKLMTAHMVAIDKSDAILVVNLEKNNQQNYIGGNTFLEMGFAFAYGKKIFVYNELPEYSPLIDEISGLLPIVIKGDLGAIGEE